MSWSKSASGTPAEVKEKVKAWESEVEATDRGYGASEGIIELHKEQARRCADATTAFADAAKEGYLISASVSGHASVSTTDIMSDQWSVSLSTYKAAVGSGG